MEAWPTVPIGELFKLKQGTYLKPDDMGETQSDEFPFPVYGANGIIGYSNRKMYGERTTLVSCRGANCGVVHYTVPNVWISNNSIACVPKGDIDPTFYYYVCENTDFGDVITGSAQPQITITNLSSKEFVRPPLPVQRRIAGILSAYDELMENSQRRIRLLEAMARALYREWFVHFRFPGHEKSSSPAGRGKGEGRAKLVTSPLGDIPQGWEVKKLFELTKVNYGKNLPTKKLADNGAHPVYGAAKIIGRYTEYTREGRTIICGCRGSVGEMQITEPQCFVTNNSFTFDPTHSDNFFWLFHTLKERGLRDVVGGAAQPQITLEGISSVELVTPPLPLRTRFQQTVAAMFEQAWALDNQIQNLRRTRDLLLPRLLSGQVELKVN